MSGSSLYRRIIAGETGAWSMPARGCFRLAAIAYASAVSLRNARYDRKGPSEVLPIPVVSVGNITAGGTGKTPFVIEIAERFDRMGFSPAVVSRGYGAADETENDEERMIQRRCPGVITVSDPNRAWAAEVAHRKCGADVIILDDGFQHRRLGRSLDIVLVDVTCPFGFGHMLPRGLLREPVASLRRAQLIALTRCDQASPAEIERIEARIRSVVGDPRLLRCRHGVTSIDYLDDSPIEGGLDGRRAVLFAGLGHPEAFATTVRSLGVDVVAHRWWPDHHRYTLRQIKAMLQSDRLPPHDLLLTTEKDAVKLRDIDGIDPRRIGVVKVSIDFEGRGGTILQSVLDERIKNYKLQVTSYG